MTEGGSILDRAVRWARQAERRLARNPIARMSVAVPRTVRFVAENLRARLDPPDEGIPVPALSPALAMHVAVDEALLSVAMGPGRFPRRSDYERVGAELLAARDQFRDAGYLDDPESYHRVPPPLEEVHVTTATVMQPPRLELRIPSVDYERISYESLFDVRHGEPGYDRWETFAPNRVAGAWLLRHDDGPRPWLMCIHGFAMGYPLADFAAFDVRHLHEDLGLNVIMPVLPLHGSRKVTAMSGDAFLSFDLINSLHGMTQAMWDIRRLLTWVRAQDPVAIGVYGVSLGGYCAALIAALEEGLDMVLCGIPVTDFPALFRGHAPAHIRMRAIDHNVLGGPAEEVMDVVSPMAIAPKVKAGRRFIYAGVGDRVVDPTQAQRLWNHWERPRIEWYKGNHGSFAWSRQVSRFVEEALHEGGLVP